MEGKTTILNTTVTVDLASLMDLRTIVVSVGGMLSGRWT